MRKNIADSIHTVLSSDEFIRSEYVEQVAIIDWLEKQYPDALFNADCGGVRYGSGLQAILRGKRMKAMGHRKGFPDIFIAEPRGQYHGLFCEMKIERGGHISSEQKEWLIQLNQRGYKALVCEGFESAKRVITDYLRNKVNE